MGTTTTTSDAPRPRTARRPLTRLNRRRAQLAVVLLLGWAPLVLLGAAERLLTGRTEPLLLDPSVHVRLLLGAPLLLLAELALARQSEASLRRLVDEGFVADDARARFDRLVRAGRHRLAARAPRLVLAGLALLFGLTTLLDWRPGPFRGAAAAGLSAARVWFAAVALPLFLFLLARALWRWTSWVITLFGLARLRLRLAGGHPDRRGGLGFLTLPTLAFHAPFLLAVSSVLCAAAGTQLLRDEATWGQLRNLFIAVAACGELVAFAPLFAFTPRLFLFRRASLVEYGELATDYVRRFQRRWMPPARRDDLLGSADLQALNDLGGAYRETTEKTSVVVFGLGEVLALVVVMLLPAVPLALAAMPVNEVLTRLAHILLGRR